MGRQYFCEFCEKSFADNPTNKSNHLKGLFHQRMKKLHYDSFKEPEEILEEDLKKTPCRRFQTGTCDFGASCRFSHMTDEKKEHLHKIILAKSEAAVKKREFADKEIRLDDWLAKRPNTNTGEVTPAQETVTPLESAAPAYVIPPVLLNFQNVPPSLLPPPPGILSTQYDADWG